MHIYYVTLMLANTKTKSRPECPLKERTDGMPSAA